MKGIFDQKGVALITVMVIAGLVSIMAVGMISSQQIDIRRTGNLVDADRALVLGRGVEDWALQILVNDDPNIDHKGEDWNLGLIPTEVEGGMVSGYLEDMQGRININNINDANLSAAYEDIIGRLFERCSVDYASLDLLKQWLDAAKFTQLGASEDDDYLSLEKPYRVGNQEMLSVSELRLILGVDEEKYQCMMPYLAALPVGTRLNVNTLSAGVVTLLADNISLAAANDLLEDRPANGYNSVSDFTGKPIFAGANLDENIFSLNTEYFLANAQVEIGHGSLHLYSLVARISSANMRVARRSIGVY